MSETHVVRRQQSAEDVSRYGYSIQALDADEPPEVQPDSSVAGFGGTLLRIVAIIPVSLAFIFGTLVLLAIGVSKPLGKREPAQPQR